MELLAGIVEIKRLRDLAVSAGKGGKRGKNRPLMASVGKARATDFTRPSFAELIKGYCRANHRKKQNGYSVSVVSP